MEKDNLIQCVDCKSYIAHNAKKCIECGAFQSKLKNNLAYVAQVAGFLAIFSSALVYIINSAPEIRKALWWKDSIGVLSLNDRKVVFSNTGDGDVFIETIEIARPMPDGDAATTTRPINKLILNGQILEYKFQLDDSAKNTYERVTVRGGDSPKSDDWVRIANHAITDGSCYELSYFESGNTQYLQVKAYYERNKIVGPMTLPHTASIHAYSMAKQRKLSIPFGIVVMVNEIKSPECEKPNNPIQQTPKSGAADG